MTTIKGIREQPPLVVDQRYSALDKALYVAMRDNLVFRITREDTGEHTYWWIIRRRYTIGERSVKYDVVRAA